MKRTPRMQQIEELMRSSRIVAGGFLGEDSRPVEEIVEADAAELARLNADRQSLARIMREIRDLARQGLGSFVPVGGRLEAAVDDSRGLLVCPWGDDTRHRKTLTTVRRQDTGKTLRFSDLSIHLIEAHGFFQGRGSAFRLEPADLVDVLSAYHR